MKKLLIVVALLSIVAGISQAEWRYKPYIQIIQVKENLATNSTTYALSASTSSQKTIEARVGRVTDGRSYVINLSTYPCYISSIDYTGTLDSEKERLKTQGAIIYGAGSTDSFPTLSVDSANVYELETDEAYYVLGGDDAESALSNDIRIVDVWE